MNFTILGIVILLSLDFCLGKIYSKCEFARELSIQFGMNYEEIQNWVCIAQNSGFDTSRKIYDRSDGHYNLGIFLISDRWWCGHGENRPEKNNCGVDCSELLSDDIFASVNCARKIARVKKNKTAYESWSNWTEDCKNRLPDLSTCNLEP